MRVATVQVFAQPLIRVVDIYQALDARAAGIGRIVGRRPDAETLTQDT